MLPNSEPDINKVLADTATNILTELFKGVKDACAKVWNRGKDEVEAHDIFGLAAKKYADKFLDLHNRLKIIGMTEPVPLLDIFVRVNILEKIAAWQWRTQTEMEAWEEEYRKRGSFSQVERKCVDGLEMANLKQHVMLLGQPGAGKSTLLRYIGIQTLQGKLERKRIPVFISLKKLADSGQSLPEFIATEFDTCHFPEAAPFIERQLDSGNMLLLLDGLDEVGKDCVNKIYDDVIRFSDKYSQNQFIISCRTAAYNRSFTRSTDVEIAEFSDEQIKSFIAKWFAGNDVKAEACREKLFLEENKPILDLARTPLLLTLLCLAFDDSMNFPANRAELYRQAVYTLLEKWYASKNIPHDEIYRHLSTPRKEQMLSRIAYQTFTEGNYFVRQDILEKQIAEFIENLPEARTETLTPDSHAILRAIEAQHGLLVERTHGIYSFSHLTLQEYFTARYIVDNVAEGALNQLMEHLTDRKWHEIFLLCAGMLPKADGLLRLMKEKTDTLVQDEKLKQLLIWAKDKATSVNAPYKPAAVRSYYMFLARALILGHVPDRDRALELARNIDLIFACTLDRVQIQALDRVQFRNLKHNHAISIDLNRDITPVLDYTLAFVLILNRDLDYNLALDEALIALARNRDHSFGLSCVLDFTHVLDHIFTVARDFAKERGLGNLANALEELRKQIPSEKAFPGEWLAWTEQLHQIMIRERNIGHKFEFTEAEQTCLENYLYANKLIVDCLNCQSYVSKAVREEIESTLLLPPGI